MLRPTKHSHPDRTLINVSLLVLSRLRKRRSEDYDALKQYATTRVSGGDVLYLPALNFLYLLGLVEYRAKTDAVEYVGKNATL
jgi:hypothetical protein